MTIFDHVHFDEKGLVPAIIVDDASGQVLTLCYMNRDAIEKTVQTGLVHVFRRTRGRLMKKGETSGHTQTVRHLFIDCDGKSLLIRVTQKVAACHKGYFTCYYTRYNPNTGSVETTGKPIFDPSKTYP